MDSIAPRRPVSRFLEARTTPVVLERIRTLAQQAADDRIAAILNVEGLTTRQGFPWTYQRVQQVRRQHHIVSSCPIMPRGAEPRGDGLVPVRTAAAILRVSPTLLQDGFWVGVRVLHKRPSWRFVLGR